MIETKNLTNQNIFLAIIMTLLIINIPLHAQKLNHYQKRTKVEKKKKQEKTTNTQSETTQIQTQSRLENYHQRTKKPTTKTNVSKTTRHHRRFYRNPRRRRHYVESLLHHRYHLPYHQRYHHRNYDPFYNEPFNDTVIIVEKETNRPPPKPEVLTQEEIQFLNTQIDVYENREGLFKISYGIGNAIGSNSGISNSQINFNFTAPPTYGPKGRNLGTWGIGYAYKGYKDSETTLHNHRIYLEGINTRLFNGFAHNWRTRIGTNVLKASTTSAGLLFGIHYELHNLEKNYAFNIGYDGTLYNIGSVEYDTTWESNLESYFRIYYGDIHTDIGAELNIVDLEEGNYFHQLFTRIGFRF